MSNNSKENCRRKNAMMDDGLFLSILFQLAVNMTILQAKLRSVLLRVKNIKTSLSNYTKKPHTNGLLFNLTLKLLLIYLFINCISVAIYLLKESIHIKTQLEHPYGITRIDVAVVSIGENDIQNMKRMISSLVMSSSPYIEFHFHLISDKKGLIAAKNWYTLWNSACATWNVYDIESSRLSKAMDQFHRLTGGKMRTAVHYHGKEALWKLLIPSFIQSDNLLVLDTDMIILRDVSELWSRWRFEQQSVFLGMPCMHRENSWLYPLWREIFPDNGTLHCMSGTLLMRPYKMMTENWLHLVASSTNKILEDFPGWTAISADQDIFNLIAKSIPEKVTNIGCEWNCYYTWFAKFLSNNEMPVSCSHRRCAVVHYNNRSYTNWWHNRTSFFQRFWDAYEDFPVSYLNAKGYSHCFF
ncbi:hypothetical protein GpartN1_g3531.t1 [Galdieria partita]|uniref:Uncharacterized protein n=1 Tax=Galdieria partita TaxID=83374 RepID=A0A9C7UQM5_9RHOD|nr:hypothetical protein GpartN1_g3531.t1 [Galdieria partita]